MELLVHVLFLGTEFLGVYQLRQTALDVAVSYIDSKYPTSKFMGKRKIREIHSFNGHGISTTVFSVEPSPTSREAATFIMNAVHLDQFVRL